MDNEKQTKQFKYAPMCKYFDHRYCLNDNCYSTKCDYGIKSLGTDCNEYVKHEDNNV